MPASSASYPAPPRRSTVDAAIEKSIRTYQRERTEEGHHDAARKSADDCRRRLKIFHQELKQFRRACDAIRAWPDLGLLLSLEVQSLMVTGPGVDIALKDMQRSIPPVEAAVAQVLKSRRSKTGPREDHPRWQLAWNIATILERDGEPLTKYREGVYGRTLIAAIRQADRLPSQIDLPVFHFMKPVVDTLLAIRRVNPHARLCPYDHDAHCRPDRKIFALPHPPVFLVVELSSL